MTRPALLLLFSAFVSAAGCSDDPGGGGPVDASTGDAGGTDAAPACTRDDDCDDGLYCNGAESCSGDPVACTSGVAPCAPELCDDDTDTCDCTEPDADGDGENSIACGGSDCDDADADRFPGNPEVCDVMAHDEDCDSTTFGDRDADDDGVVDAACCDDSSGVAVCGTDCDDSDASVSPTNTEACNLIDDDCDGTTDEMVMVTLWPDADGDMYATDDAAAVPTMGCSESPGLVLMRGDCDDMAMSVNPAATEVCNAIDDNCNTLVDDISPGTVVCASGQTRTCTNACGVAGSSTCAADCLGFDPCIATEVCNGCDDDADGAIDDGFPCAMGTAMTCTTMCSTPGSVICDATCNFAAACTAPTELCNYCDDDGDGDFFGERPLAIVDDLGDILTCGGASTTFGGVARCAGIGSDPLEIYGVLLTGSAVDTAGIMWVNVPMNVGWGPVQIDAIVQARTIGTGTPLGGWSVILARAGGTGVGTPQRRGVPAGVRGLTFDWLWSTFNVTGMTPFPSPGDGMRPHRDATIPLGGGLDVDGQAISPTSTYLDAGDSTFVTQAVTIVYTPDDPRTPPNEELIRFTAGGTTRTYQMDTNPLTNDPRNEMPVGSPLRLGFAAGSFSRVIPPAPPGTFGARVEARVWLQTFRPPMGAGSPTITGRTVVSRRQLCPGT